MSTTESSRARLEEMIRTATIEDHEQAVELALALEGPQIFEELLAGSEYHVKSMVLHPGPAFARTPQSLLADHNLCLRFLAASELPFRFELEALSLTASVSYNAQTELPLGVLGAFPNLRTVRISAKRSVDIGALRSLPNLDTLILAGSQFVVSGFASLRSIKTEKRTKVEVNDCPSLWSFHGEQSPTFSGTSPLSRLSTRFVDEALLERAPNLEALRCDFLAVNQSRPTLRCALGPFSDNEGFVTLTGDETAPTIAGCTDIERLRFRIREDPIDLTPIAKLRDLRLLDLTNQPVCNLDALVDHPSLIRVAANGSTIDNKGLPPKLRSIISLSKNPKLQDAYRKAVRRGQIPKPPTVPKVPLPKKKKSIQVVPVDLQPPGEVVHEHPRWPEVIDLLKQRTVEQSVAAARLAAELDEASIDKLFSAIELKPYWRGGHEVKARMPFRLKEPTDAVVVASALLLAGSGSKHETAQGLRRLERLQVVGKTQGGTDVAISTLDGFESVTHLSVEQCRTVRIEGLVNNGLRHLEAVALRSVEFAGPLSDSLETVTLTTTYPMGLEHIAASRISKLTLMGVQEVDCETLTGAANLTLLQVKPLNWEVSHNPFVNEKALAVLDCKIEVQGRA